MFSKQRNLIYKHGDKIILQHFDRKQIERHSCSTTYLIGHYYTLYQTL